MRELSPLFGTGTFKVGYTLPLYTEQSHVTLLEGLAFFF